MSARADAARRALVAALAKCKSLTTRASRDDIVAELGSEIGGSIDRREELLDDVANVVRRCADFPGGIDKLLEPIEFKEGKTSQWPEVERAANAFKAAVIADATAAAGASVSATVHGQTTATPPSLAAAGAAAVASREPPLLRPAQGQTKFALVIGISRYQHGQPAGQPLAQEQFSNLSFAAQDALAFREFLALEAGYQAQPALTDECACQRDILHGLDELRKACRNSTDKNPLVLVFFSGHGATDADNRSYLMPYDARPDRLFSTALWSKTFSNALAEIETDNLVLFIDACHAGTIGAEGVKDAGLLQYDPARLAADESRRKHRVIASCSAGQMSREFGGHGIFTHHLLSLLRCEQPEEFPDDAIDLWELYATLKRRVAATARDRFGADQEPYANIEGPTGIVIAVNERRRAQRLAGERRYLPVLVAELERTRNRRRATIASLLVRYLKEGEVDESEKRCCRLFQEQTESWLSDGVLRPTWCEDLARSLGLDAVLLGPTQRPPSPARAVEGFAADVSPAAMNAAPDAAGKARSSDAFTSSPSGKNAVAPVAPQAERRKLRFEDCRSVLERIWKIEFMYEAQSLQDLMMQPAGVSMDELVDGLMKPRYEEPATREAWRVAATEVLSRFKQHWPAAEVVPSQSAWGLRYQRDGDGHA